MSVATSTTIDTDVDQYQDQRPPAEEPIPAECNPDRFLNWRLRYAHHLATQTDERPLVHDDPWVQETANLFASSFDHGAAHIPTIVHLAIKEAFELSQTNSLQRHVLEARLLAQQTPGEIYQRCQFALLTITAYAKLHFDVRGHERMRVWFPQQFTSITTGNFKLWQIAVILKNTGAYSGPEALEGLIDVLCRLEGPTMADGLPDRSSPDFGEELLMRHSLADPLLPRNRVVQRLLERFTQAAVNDVRAGKPSGEAVAAGIEILQKAKIPVALRKQIAKLRESLAPAPALPIKQE